MGMPGFVLGEITEGTTMSRTYSAPENEHQKQSKANFRTYFYNTKELQELIAEDMSTELEAKLLVSSAPMRREFRRLARRMRARYV